VDTRRLANTIQTISGKTADGIKLASWDEAAEKILDIYTS
jgi:hypothetical protein